MKNMFPHLFTPGTIGSCEIKNRLVMPALSTGLCNADGTVSDAYTAFYTTRAKGGAGLIITEFAAVNNTNGRHSPNQIGIWSDNHIPGLASFAETMHEYGAKVFVQLCHPGSQSYIKSDTPLLTPSGVESRVFGNPVRPMTKSEIHAIVRDFAAAALRAQKAGLDGIEISAAHGYLLHEFLSPYTNKRTDEYGGSTMNRCRFVKEMLEAVREKVGPDFPIMLRISAEDYLISAGIMEKGMTLSDTVAILNYLIPCGVDAVSVSSGTYDTQNSAWEPVSYPQGWRMYLADTIRQNVPVPVVGVSVIREPEYAEGIIKRGAVDFVGVARGQMA
ncbi:MAG: NADH:flavin oxidoreductase, partial [Oscillospiraceae bacterium]|nr:NADH:flavin oxidoreductase [Oscillospiraceae bacterium]